MSDAGGVELRPLGDSALLLRFGDTLDASLSARVLAAAAALRADAPAWLRDVVPAYASLGLHIDADALDAADPLASAARWVRERLAQPPVTEAPAARPIDIVVRYGGADGPDLVALAERVGLAPEAVVARHAAGDYRVAMLGFAPGFPYLLGLDPALALPRKDTPARRVAAGSVAIGGAQTGIYPRPGPAGWHVIGRTAAALFDPYREPPSLLQPGDRVRFVAA